jgi:hypothetical protein
MDATRGRLSFDSNQAAEHLQWAAVAGLAVLLVLFTSLLVREMRFAPSVASVDDSAGATVVPSEAVSVPSLILAAGRQVRVGEAENDADVDLRMLPLLKRAEERGPLGVREVRAYQGVTLVFEPFERAGAPRVAAIYLQ